MLACKVRTSTIGGEKMGNKDMEKELVMLAGAVAMSIMLDDFQLIAQKVQELLINGERVIAIMCLEQLLESSKNDRSLAHFLDKHKQEFNALTKVVLNELEKELRLEENEDE